MCAPLPGLRLELIGLPMDINKTTLFTFSILSLVLNLSPAAIAEGTLRIGVLAYGTLSWELATIHDRRLDEAYAFRIDQRPLANPQAGKIALQSGAVDMIVSDWVWVSRQRNEGARYTFSPYSTASGSLIVPKDSRIDALEDLPGKRIGIAGGELDKNWLLLIALAKKTKNIDLDGAIEKIYAAPPLLNHELLQNNLDAVLTYWHYAAQLEALGYREILNGDAILAGLGIDQPLPTLGYVFRDDWAGQNRELIRNFFSATAKAKELLCESEEAWAAIGPLTQTDDPKVQNLLRVKYCAGRIKQWNDRHKALAATVFGLLHEVAGPRLTGSSRALSDGTFWND
jgi:NitT/TauT family transport system substrate-binding protein